MSASGPTVGFLEENLRKRTDTSGGFFREVLIDADGMIGMRRFLFLLTILSWLKGTSWLGSGAKNAPHEFVDFPLIAKRPR